MNSMTILVADDDPVIRKLFEKRLGKEGYTVTIAADGAEAARLLDTRPFDVIITDLVMPGKIGGIELLKLAKEKSVEIEVIVITAHSSIDTAVDAMKKGAVDYLEKPINFDELFLRLEKISERKALMKNAGDLREAMEVTESSAAQTIQNLEIINSNQQQLLDQLETILTNGRQEQGKRIEQALHLLTNRSL
ncbi:response regulator receiver protein [Desulfobulbus propionicus DSM 2032]|uniref:Response regulator receiver protein n=1 Tax=Desulfobulbus propionicus (strain ATCC 33891 / DSM 2032 / VKM B-1956 / 1pr3) TaxID=577650 RepID=A0A7U3YM94_DESPD|nr:response regulator [Desulfobulbus propionicus]ADW17974.1 response regulator receiver protein [Desulfobulbus propionicus DSM 2032]